jgi:hypothetical protein
VAAPKALSAYDLLLRVIQQQNLDSTRQSNSDINPQGGLPGRLLAVQASQNQQQLSALNNEQIPSARDPNFRQLSRLVQPREVAAPSIVPDSADSLGVTPEGLMPIPDGEQYAMGRKPTYSECVDECMHILLNPPNGDLQSSDFRRCVGQCMGRL